MPEVQRTECRSTSPFDYVAMTYRLVLLSLWATTLSAQPASVPRASLRLVGTDTRCDAVAVDGRTVSRGDGGLVTIDTIEAGTHEVSCGAPFTVYLPARSQLTVTLQADSAPRFAGTAADVNQYLQKSPALSTAAFAELWRVPPPTFRSRWQGAWQDERRALAAVRGADSTFRARERARLDFRHAWGRVTYPFFRWRESDDREIVVDPAVPEILRRVSLADERWWALTEHRELLAAIVHERARTLLATTSALQRGDARWLRAEFAAVTSLFPDAALQREAAFRVLFAHLDDNDSRGVDSVYQRWLALSPSASQRSQVDSMLNEDRARMAAYPSAVYREVDGVPLFVHVMRPIAGDSTGDRPAMLWFHGGSGTTGSWYQSPGMISALRQRGVTVLAIEFRTGARFDNDADALSDAARAFQWAVRSGTPFGIDTARIGVAGFSSGSLLALQLATMGVDMTTGAVATSPTVPSRRLPTGVMVTGACPNPAEDAYTRKMLARHGSAIQPSPMSHVSTGLPPMLIVQASDDNYCAFADADRFARMLRAAGNRADFVEVPGGGHFFGFYYPPGQRLLRDGITRALQEWGWMAR